MKSLYFFVVLFLGASYGLTCTQQYQCSSVSTDYNYVACVNGACVCRDTFRGNASSTNPCSCPYTVAYGGGTPYCIQCDPPRSIIYDENSFPRCISIAECGRNNDRAAQQKAVITEIYSNLIAPKPRQILANASLVANLFAANISGRITPVGHYDDLEGTIEYFYGLATNVVSLKIINLISEGNTAAVRVDIFFQQTRPNGQPASYNITQTGFFHFDTNGKVFLYDLTLLRLGDASNPNVYGIEDLLRQVICKNAMTYCNESAPYNAYSSFQQCVDFLRSIPVGSFDRANSNSLVCRLIHNALVQYRPQIHCPHVGPTGGGKCIDVSYDSWYSEPYY